MTRSRKTAFLVPLLGLAVVTVHAQSPQPAGRFAQRLALHGITFDVACANDSAHPTLTVTPAHLAVDNSVITRSVDGTVTSAAVADLNADGSPEVYVFVARTGTVPGTDLVAYSANRKKSLSEIVLPPVEPGTPAADGYRGRDTLRIVKATLVRRFPLYAPGDTDDHPTGGTREVAYSLAQGEATWVLKQGRVRSVR